MVKGLRLAGLSCFVLFCFALCLGQLATEWVGHLRVDSGTLGVHKAAQSNSSKLGRRNSGQGLIGGPTPHGWRGLKGGGARCLTARSGARDGACSSPAARAGPGGGAAAGPGKTDSPPGLLSAAWEDG